MSEGGAALDAFAARLRALGAAGLPAVAREAVPLVQLEARATAAAGTDPYGQAWRPRRDGSRAIPEAAAAVDVVARGPVVVVRVARGAAIQNQLSESVGRRVIPDAMRGIPPRILAALEEAAKRVFLKAMG